VEKLKLELHIGARFMSPEKAVEVRERELWWVHFSFFRIHRTSVVYDFNYRSL